MQFEKVENKRKSQAAADILLQMIKKAKYPPGSKLPTERKIAEGLGVCRNTLREAVAALEIIGVLEVRRSQGIFVVAELPPSALQEPPDLKAVFSNSEDPFEVIDARIAFEPGVAVAASKEATDSEVIQFGSIINEMRTALEKDQAQEYLRQDKEFHILIAKLTHNQLIVKTIENLMSGLDSPLWRTMKKDQPLKEEAANRVAEHLAIFSAMASRNELEIWKSMRQHLENSKKRFLE